MVFMKVFGRVVLSGCALFFAVQTFAQDLYCPTIQDLVAHKNGSYSADIGDVDFTSVNPVADSKVVKFNGADADGVNADTINCYYNRVGSTTEVLIMRPDNTFGKTYQLEAVNRTWLPVGNTGNFSCSSSDPHFCSFSTTSTQTK